MFIIFFCISLPKIHENRTEQANTFCIGGPRRLYFYNFDTHIHAPMHVSTHPNVHACRWTGTQKHTNLHNLACEQT